MKVTSRDDAWELANIIFPTDYIQDEEATKKAGYPIYYSTAEGIQSWISDLGNRLELNILTKGKGVESKNIWVEEPKEVVQGFSKEQLIGYLQSQMDNFKKYENRYGIGNEIVIDKLDAMIACKEMVEALIQEPVNLRQDGKVTTGY